MKTVEEIENGLSQCYCTSQYHKHWLGKLYTDGVKFLIDSADAHWLLDLIFSYDRREEFQVWKMVVTRKIVQGRNKTCAVVTMKTDSGKPILIQQKIPFTDFPLDEITLWVEDGVLLLPSEH
jgi:hypothetical protein